MAGRGRFMRASAVSIDTHMLVWRVAVAWLVDSRLGVCERRRDEQQQQKFRTPRCRSIDRSEVLGKGALCRSQSRRRVQVAEKQVDGGRRTASQSRECSAPGARPRGAQLGPTLHNCNKNISTEPCSDTCPAEGLERTTKAATAAAPTPPFWAGY